MKLEQINELTKKAYNKTADKYHYNFKNELIQKDYDRLLLDRFSGIGAWQHGATLKAGLRKNLN